MNTHANIGLIQMVSAQLSEMLGDDFDPETFWDTLDGETDVMDVIEHLLRDRVESKSFAIASKEIANEYNARAGRMVNRGVAISKSLGAILDATNQSKVVHPLATISRTKGRTSLHIIDESEIPSQLTVTTVKPDNTAIKKALEAGEVVPGAELVTSDAGVTVRVK